MLKNHQMRKKGDLSDQNNRSVEVDQRVVDLCTQKTIHDGP